MVVGAREQQVVPYDEILRAVPHVCICDASCLVDFPCTPTTFFHYARAFQPIVISIVNIHLRMNRPFDVCSNDI